MDESQLLQTLQVSLPIPQSQLFFYRFVVLYNMQCQTGKTLVVDPLQIPIDRSHWPNIWASASNLRIVALLDHSTSVRPKLGLNIQLKHALNQTTDVVG